MTTEIETETIIIECYKCGAPVEWVKYPYYHELCTKKPERCQACIEVESELNREKTLAKLEDDIFQLTPRRYNATDSSHADFNVRLWEKVAAWNPTSDRPWLGLVGPTGKCKTRCAYLKLVDIAKAMVRKSGETWWIAPSIKAITAYDFADAVKNQHFDNSEEKADAKEFLSHIKRVDILLIDDLGKCKNTESLAGDRFALIDRRHEDNRRTIWTSNLTPEGIVAGMAENIGLPLAGRIRECSTIFNVK